MQAVAEGAGRAVAMAAGGAFPAAQGGQPRPPLTVREGEGAAGAAWPNRGGAPCWAAGPGGFQAADSASSAAEPGLPMEARAGPHGWSRARFLASLWLVCHRPWEARKENGLTFDRAEFKRVTQKTSKTNREFAPWHDEIRFGQLD